MASEVEPLHIPVMSRQAMELLHLPVGGVAVDGTVGLGGHALLIARSLGSYGHLIALDRDNTSLDVAKKRLASCSLRKDFINANFSQLEDVLNKLQVSAVDAILLDLGISSFQLDTPGRGFAFKSDGPLDMRMDPLQAAPTAADLVNALSEVELEKVIRDYSEEPFSRRIASAIVRQRVNTKITTTRRLADVVLRALPGGYRRGRIHPATRTFQALRIAVNQELEHLSLGLTVGFNRLKSGGRLCVISFHSLEDRLVKNRFRLFSLDQRGRVLTKRPLTAEDEECEDNPRSRSAKMRAIERI